jgi:hypothetical protein
MKPLIIGLTASVLAAIGVKRFAPRLLHRGGELAELTKDELYKKAQEADIPGRSEMTKDELIEALGAAS